ncbi:D-2-hydroxyacid dehydrogenase [Geothermobacter hydrogeniphilus]|uniref:Glycerate dehydrogenase n=1 Tax=Geothermobacter hydrogeniphilus TaxID=1969733 RepID=A0A1X0XW80_9BACT|nr:D-2-hydroxyacid dehydrogenase [Geothermobacter hydrogeniphilus]ORJ57144.1 glycerate dehydrogenase [Geothermobacter hydrogeniphilus]
MKIVYLDAYTANPGDLSWEPLEQLGDLSVYDRSAEAEVLSRIGDAEIVLTNKVTFDRARFAALPNLRYVGVTATGYNIIDLEAAREHGVTVTNVPAYSTASVAQMTFALLLELTQQVGHHNHLTSWGHWTDAPDFCFWDRPQVELAGLTFGLVGFGQIGQRVARIAAAFGMKVQVFTRNPDRYHGNLDYARVHFVVLEELLKTSDVVSLHCPLTEETSRLINAERLALMKRGAYLINTSRGGVIDEEALADALKEKRLAGAGLDVLTLEPPEHGNRLLAAQNCFVTPHIAWATRASRQRLFDTLTANIEAFLAGKPQNVVS